MKTRVTRSCICILTFFVISHPYDSFGKSIIVEDTIKWSSSRKLDFSDFRGDYTKEPGVERGLYKDTLGLSYITIQYNLKIVDRALKIDAYAVFDRGKSWIKTNSPKLLRHEQGHFDITEIYALQLEKTMNETKFRDVDSFLDALRVESVSAASACQKKNEEYDILIKSDILKQELFKWIDEQLELYKQYQ